MSKFEEDQTVLLFIFFIIKKFSVVIFYYLVSSHSEYHSIIPFLASVIVILQFIIYVMLTCRVWYGK
jgi:hypothetical protein